MVNEKAAREYLESNDQSKQQRHWLGNKYCPLKSSVLCSGQCAWFDHEEEDCRLIGGFWKIREELREMREVLERE